MIAVVGSGAWLVSRAPASAPRVDATPDAGRAGFVLRFVPGHETTYDVSYRSDGALSVGDGDAGALASTFHARLVRTVLADATTGNHAVLYRFLDARVVLAVNDANVEQEARDVAASLATGVVAEHAAAGQVVVLRFAPSSTALSRSFARALLSWIQITLPRELAPTWSARETDTNGPYVAGYTRVGDDGALRKTKRTGAASDDQGGFPVAVHGATHYRSIVEVDFDLERGGMKEIAGEEWVETFFGAFSLGTTRSTFEATRTNERTLEPAALGVLTEETRTTREAAPTALDAHDPTARFAARKEASERWLGKATLPEILRDLHAEAAAPTVDRQFSVFLRLTSYAFLHPEACARIAELLPSLAPSGDEATTVLQALGATGSNEAQSALASVLLASTTKLALRLRIVATLGMLAHPSEESEAALWDPLESTCRHASLSIL